MSEWSPPRALPVLALASLLGFACGEEAVETAPQVRPVRSVEVGLAPDTVERVLAGVARSEVEARLSFRVAGTLERIAPRLGQQVSKDELLARLDPADLELRVGEAEAGLAAAKAAERRAEADYERARSLYENDNASLRELDVARSGAESAAAQVESATKRLEQARRQLGYAELRAPAAGSVVSIDVEVNENVGVGQTVLVLASTGPLEVEVAVPEGLINRLDVGLGAEVRFEALGERIFAGRLSELGVAAGVRSGSFDAVVTLVEPSAEIRSGMAADVRLRFSRGGPEGISVPSVSVLEDRSGRHVFVLEGEPGGEGTAHRRVVVVGRILGHRIEILDGLEAGERIATAGVRRLVDGMTVRLLEGDEG